jgi:hypothetical protein
MVHGLITGRPHSGWTAAFLATTILTSLTGFPLPATQLLPSHIVGIISTMLLVIAIAAIYFYHLKGAWRRIYVVTAIAALYLNVFVGVVQSFRKISFLAPLAPTESEPPFVATQAVVLIIFIILGVVAANRFDPLRSAA